MNDKYTYPLNFRFNIGTLSNDFTATDANGNILAYVRQKIMTIKSQVDVFSDTNKTHKTYTINADAWLKFNISFTFTNLQNNQQFGRIVRKGVKSLWKSRYEIYDENDRQDLLIQEENAWVKVGDYLFSHLPSIGIFTGYIFNPSYIITRPDGTQVVRIKKEASFMGHSFSVQKIGHFEQGEEERILFGTMMMLLVERRRG